ncbi:MAG: hypothetical protein WDO56_15865 [Gammaproteobacteria bacterium]
MAAKKSIPKKPGAHHRQANDHERLKVLGRRKPKARRLPEPCADCEPAAQIALRLREPDDVVECLSNRLALVETVSLAMREFEDHPGVGPICTALEQAVDLLGRAHSAVNLYLQRGRS